MIDLDDGVFMDQVEELVEGKRWAALRDMLLLLEPADIALILDKLPEERLPLLYRLLPKETAAEVFVEMEPEAQALLIKGFSDTELKEVLETHTTYGAFFPNAPCLHPERELIKGVVCGVRVEEIADPLMREIRRLDKLIDELAKGKPMEKILRQGERTRAGRMAEGRKEASAGKRYEYDAVIHVLPEKDGAYVIFPWNIRDEFGRGRVKVHATFDGIPYDGSIVNMGLKNDDGSVCYILGMLKSIRTRLGKGAGDTVHLTIQARE